jgi:hypothetical protein
MISDLLNRAVLWKKGRFYEDQPEGEERVHRMTQPRIGDGRLRADVGLTDAPAAHTTLKSDGAPYRRNRHHMRIWNPWFSQDRQMASAG